MFKLFLNNFVKLNQKSKIKKIGDVVIIISLIPVVLLIRLISPIVLIRVDSIRASGIGHLLINNDIYINEKKDYHKRNIDLFFYDSLYGNKNHICNEYALKKILENGMHKFISKRFIYLWKCHRLFPYHEKFITITSDFDKFNTILNSPSNIKFSKDEIDYIETILSKYNISEFVCMANRDSNYKDKVFGKGKTDFQNIRNSKFSNCKKAIEHLSGYGISTIRMGKTIDNSDLYKGMVNISERNEAIDFLLFKKAKFSVIPDSGVSSFSSFLRKKVLIHDLVNMHKKFIYVFQPQSLFLPKKYFSKEKEKYLSFAEISKLFYSEYSNEADVLNSFKCFNIEVHENGEDEILEAVKEMNERVDEIYVESKIDYELQQKIWLLFMSEKEFDMYQPRIPKYYIEKNDFLVDGLLENIENLKKNK
ncbi:TIGR04372 family glycosyltransferase [Sulfurimonas sp.]|nr:TIGR04372 family glycosyltransferase [Sulfurimonas sp.]